MTEAEALEFLKTDDPGRVEELRLRADQIRRRLWGERATYVINRNINFTNICTLGCRFCGFSRAPGEDGTYEMDLESLLGAAGEAVREGATEVCIQGGIHPGLKLDFYLRILRSLKERYPGLHIHAFSPMEVYSVAQKEGLRLAEILRRLKSEGLGSMPGTAAEILVDRVRREICPSKLSTAQWREVITTAHRLGIPTTATIMFGHVDSPRDQVAHLSLLREIQKETGGFTEFVPLPFTPYQTVLGKEKEISPMTVEYVLRFYALSRLFFGETIAHLQSSWPKLGLPAAAGALNWGVDDIGGTLGEEKITAGAGGQHGQSHSPEELERAITEAGFRPARRDTLYSKVA